MKIGITYDLKETYLKEGYSCEEVAEFESNETIDALEQAILKLGHTPDLIGNAKSLLLQIAGGNKWDLVFNICEGLEGYSREAQVPAILDLYKIPYTFSDPLVLSIALHKEMTKRIMRDLGIPTAPFAVVQSLDDIKAINLNFPLFAKPIAEGTSKGVMESKITSQDQLRKACEQLIVRFKQPVLVEEYLPGREFTVGVLGSGSKARTLGVMEILISNKGDNDFYSYDLKTGPDWAKYFDCRLEEGALADACAEIALKAWRGLGCCDAGRVDLRLGADGTPNFIEVNPLAGLRPGYSDLAVMAGKQGMSYIDLIQAILDSAISRVERKASC